MKVGFIGAGNMASAMIGGIINSKLLSPSNIIASAKTHKNLANIKEKYKINTTKDSISLVKECDIVVAVLLRGEFTSFFAFLYQLCNNNNRVA